MNCSKCGAQIPDNSNVCPNCGNTVQQVYNAAVTSQVSATPILILGILSLVLAETVIGGLICAIICKSKLKAYNAAGGQPNGMTKAGKILSTVGLIFSILAIVMWVVIIASAVAVALSGNVVYN